LTALSKDARNAMDFVNSYRGAWERAISTLTVHTKLLWLIALITYNTSPEQKFPTGGTFGEMEGKFLLTALMADSKGRSYSIPLSIIISTATNDNYWDILTSYPIQASSGLKAIEFELSDFLPFPYLITEARSQSRLRGEKGERMVAGTLWARYIIHCKLNGLDIGQPVPLSVILPQSTIPSSLISATVVMKGCYSRNSRFKGEGENILELCVSGPVLNAPGATHADVFLQVDCNKKKHILCFQV